MKQYGLIGRPLGHSRSAEIFNARAAENHIEARYDLYELPSISDFISLVGGNPDLEGLNVTIPYKRDIIPYLDILSPEAREAGAVNTVRIIRRSDGSVKHLEGYNTDITGFIRALAPILPDDVQVGERRALVLGSGGASGAVTAGLRQLGWTPVTVSRTPAESELGYSDLTPEIVLSHLLVVNTTPLGMAPRVNSAPPFPFQYLTRRHVCFDLIYNPELTLFMRIAAAHGCKVSNGLDMLRFQAEDARVIWGVEQKRK